MDRNTPPKVQALAVGRSLSARRAWIEIATSLLVYLALIVALRKESVDRNFGYPSGD